MGYTTDFTGEFEVTPPLAPAHIAYLLEFSGTRRMRRDAAKAALRPDPIRSTVGLPVGTEGEYFVGEEGFKGQESGDDVLDHNTPPSTQPGLWCHWVPGQDGKTIEWDGGEKFYEYIPWLVYLIEHFLTGWGYKINGEVQWQGEEAADRGKIVVKNNEVFTAYALFGPLIRYEY